MAEALRAGGVLRGRTLGHVKQPAGWFLFAPHEDDGAALQRVFLPHAAVAAIGFDKSAEEQAAERWIATPAQLLARYGRHNMEEVFIDIARERRLDLAPADRQAAKP